MVMLHRVSILWRDRTLKSIINQIILCLCWCAFITMIFCSRCDTELDEDKLHTTADVSDTEIICRDCWYSLQQ